MIDSPCLDCKERILKCHSTCDKYINYRKDKDTLNRKIKDVKDKESMFYDLKHKAYKRR